VVAAQGPRKSPPPPPKRGRGRPKKGREPPEIVICEEELREEDYLEKQIQEALENGEVQESQSEVEKAKEEERLRQEQERATRLAAEQQKIDAERAKKARMERGADFFGDAPEWNPGDSLTAEDLEAEFANDPEVENCLLSEVEIKIKEQIWVAHNEDWLRKQAEKDMMARIAKATGDGGRKSKANKARGKKRSKMGDGSVLTESSTPIETPADAAKAMLERRAPLKSQYVDFSALQRIYGRETPSRASSSAPEASGEASRAASATPAPASPEQDQDTDFEDTQAGASRDPPRSPPRAVTFNDIPTGDAVADDEDPDAEEDFHRALQGDITDIATVEEDDDDDEMMDDMPEMDEFGVIGDSFDYDEGEEYE
jgi:transcription factor IIIB subunit 2